MPPTTEVMRSTCAEENVKQDPGSLAAPSPNAAAFSRDVKGPSTKAVVKLANGNELDLRSLRESLAEAERTAAAQRMDASGSKFVPPKQLLMYLVRMGSFTSQPKAVPAPDAESNDDDVHYQNTRVNLNLVLQMCSNELKTMPPPFNRKWMKVADQSGTNRQSSNASTGETIRLLQWNVLSQSLGTKNDNFVRCPDSALNWRTRRFRMLEEMVRFDPDIICLQEVDHFRFLRKSLASLGYVGHFLPKPDSPCLYLTDNSGPDGCALFYKEDKFDLCKIDHRILEVWRVQSNQVLMSAMLRSRSSHEEFVVATTHLKARNGAILSTLRNEQGKDLIDHLASFAAHRPVIIAGDFNAEPIEPVYMTMTNDSQLRLASAYAQAQVVGCEPKYTTWKIREDGEHIETLDYIFHSKDRFRLEQVLELPSGEDIGPNRLPSLAFASDHLSLACDLKLLPAK